MAYSGTCGDDLTWTFDRSVLAISGTGAMYEYSGVPPWFDVLIDVSEVQLGEGITHISSGAFSGVNATSIIIPKSVTSIGDAAFSYSLLTSITFESAAAPTLGANSFNLGSNAATVYTKGWGSDAVFTNDVKGSTTFTYETLTSGNPCGASAYWEYDESTNTLYIFGSGAMYDYTSTEHPPWRADYRTKVRTIQIYEGITEIGNYAFNVSLNLSTVSIPSTVTRVGASAIRSCSALRSVSIPDSVTIIEEYAFQNDYRLTSIAIPDSVTTIGVYAFYGCTGLKSLIVQGNPKIGGYCFQNCTSMTEIRFEGSQPTFGAGSFRLGSSSDPVTASVYSNGWASDEVFTSSVKNSYTNFNYVIIGICGTNAEWELDLSTGILRIFGTGAMTNYDSGEAPWYSYRESINTIVIESGITTIGNYTFSGCSALTSITIPDGVTRIGTYAFNSCSWLREISFPESLTTIDDYAFHYATRLTAVTTPTSLTSIGTRAFYKCTALTTLVILGATKLGTYAFQNCSALSEITLSEGVPSIGIGSFYDCTALTSVTIPSTVVSLSQYAFRGCSALTEIRFEGPKPSFGSDSFTLGTSSNPVTATVYSSGWASDTVFTTTVKGSYTTLIYKTLGGEPTQSFTIPGNVLGTWKDCPTYGNVKGDWKKIIKGWFNVKGTWKRLT